MLKRIPKVVKILVLGAGTFGFGTLAYHQYQKNENIQIKNSLLQPGIKIQNTVQMAMAKTQNPDNRQAIQSLSVTNNQNNQNQSTNHKHDSDIRVLDMIGFPAVNGSNILQQQSHATNKQQKIQKKDDNQTQKQQEIQHHENSQQDLSKPLNKQNNEQRINQNNQQNQKIENKAEKSKQNNQYKLIKQVKNYNKIKDIPVFDFNQNNKFDDQFVLIISDLSYNDKFQKQILNKIAKVSRQRKSSKPLQIFRLDLNNPEIKKKASQNLSKSIQEQTILLLKNPYDNQFINIDFNMYVQHQNVPSIYLSDLKSLTESSQLERELTKKMTANDTYLLLVADSSNDLDFSKRKQIAKYIQIQLGVQHMDNIKVCVVDHRLAKSAGIVSQQSAVNSLHLIRKSNQFTYKTPNRYLYDNRMYHVIQNISLYDKNRSILLPRYLNKVQTFSSLKVDAPYVCYVNIDRNRASPQEQRKILKVISNLKQSEEFPMVSYVLRFGQVQYKGQLQQKFSPKKFTVKLANLDELDRQSMLHQIKSQQDAKILDITESKWLKDTFQFLYKQPEITQQGLKKFITRCLNGQQPQFYKSQKKFKLQQVDKLTGNNFGNKILSKEAKNRSHLVFEYSDYCQACQVLSPLIQNLSEVFQKFPQIGINVHAFNCDKNRTKDQLYSPYTPNLYYYSKNWQNKFPIRYPLVQLAKYNGIWGIYDFCIITELLKKIQLAKVQEHIKNVIKDNVRFKDFQI